MNEINTEKRRLPLLVGLSVVRTGEDTLPGHYDEEQDVWVVDGCDGSKPIIEMAANIAELETKTDVVREIDDPGSMLYIEASTKTEVKPERDDELRTSMMELPQLFTKTKVQKERDDQ